MALAADSGHQPSRAVWSIKENLGPGIAPKHICPSIHPPIHLILSFIQQFPIYPSSEVSLRAKLRQALGLNNEQRRLKALSNWRVEVAITETGETEGENQGKIWTCEVRDSLS